MNVFSERAQLQGLWLALDQCRYDQSTLQPLEGLLVDADVDLATLCGRLREAGKSSCAITYCDDDDVLASIAAQYGDDAALPGALAEAVTDDVGADELASS